MPDYTPALTLWPEWAWAIDLPHKLAKRVENRSSALPIGVWSYLHAGKHIGGRLGIPARVASLEAVAARAIGAGMPACSFVDADGGGIVSRGDWASEADRYKPVACRPIVTSAILGRFRVSHAIPPGLTEICDGVRGWKVLDSYGNVFQYQRLNQPVPCKGAQGLWRLPLAVEMEIANVGFEVTNG